MSNDRDSNSGFASAPGHHRSYARLRTAQSLLAEGKAAEAREELERLRQDAACPDVHRSEAEELIQEIDRVKRGLPARDPSASRTPVAPARPMMELFVSPVGSDASPGTHDRPFATLARARDAARVATAKGLPRGGIAVTLLPGTYRVTETVAFAADDGGTEESPVVYRAAEKGTAVLYGGTRISGFVPVADPAILSRLPPVSRGHVMQCDLRAQGITDYGELTVRGMSQPPSPPTLELYFDGKPMTLARWPNQGFVAPKRLVEPGVKGQKPSVLEYDDDRHARWTTAEDLWLFGYFKWLWADATIRIARVDTAARTLTSAEAYDYEGGMDTTQGIIYYAFNLLEEIDMAGEWYLDRKTGILYFWPPSDPAEAVVEIGVLAEPVVTVDRASHLRFEGLAFDLGRYACLVAKECRSLLVAACTVTRFAGNGIVIDGGDRCGILGCDISAIGRRATEVMGGDRRTLTPGGHFVENCCMHDFGRIDRTYTPAVQLEGVGNRVAHNLMYDCPSSVMRIEGNDHLVEYNEVHSAVRESDDQGTMELFLNPSYRGVVFRFNRFHHNGKTGRETAVHGQAAIRLDDVISGVVIYGNIFHRSANGNFGGVQINSGRDNIIDNNVFADCKQGVSGEWHAGNVGWRMIREGRAPEAFHHSELYLSRYPAMAWMMDDHGTNHVWRNVFYRCGRIVTGRLEKFDVFENRVYDADPGFAGAAAGDFRLEPEASLFAEIAFRPIPVAEIGLFQDEYRATWPVVTTPVEIPDWR